MMERVRLDGVAELKRSLEELGTEVATKVGVKANREAAKELQGELVQSAPHDARVSRLNTIYGTLRQNIRVRRQRARNQGYIIHLVTIGAAFWGFFQEFGTVRMGARPWFRPAFERMLGRLREAQAEGLRNGIEAAARRAARHMRRRG
jgi:HK97 gp10 family phage protein